MVPENQVKELYLIIKASQREYANSRRVSEKNREKPFCGVPENNTPVGYETLTAGFNTLPCVPIRIDDLAREITSHQKSKMRSSTAL